MTHIVGLVGAKGAGKTTAAAGLSATKGFARIKFADGLKDMTRSLLDTVGFDEEQIEELVEGGRKEEPLPQLGGVSARQVMQTLGTDWGRAVFGDNFWVDIFAAAAARRRLVVCDDVRFPNEAEYIANAGGVLIRVIRPEEIEEGYTPPDAHASEMMLREIACHHHVLNDGSIGSLINTVCDLAFDKSEERKLLVIDGEKV